MNPPQGVRGDLFFTKTVVFGSIVHLLFLTMSVAGAFQQ
jgi:hypothetical protein